MRTVTSLGACLATALAVATARGGPPSSSPANTPTDTEQPNATASPSASEPPREGPAPAAPDGPPAMAIDTVLASGIRVIVARDLTLPVAAVVLAIETGTEDDPSDAPGLVHALAYQLLQGNREYAPQSIAQRVHNTGGIAMLAVGPAQIRYESLVPASRLSETITAEALRLRAPTVNEALWRDTLRAAGRDRGRTWTIPAAVRSAAHQAAGLQHDGHSVPAALANWSVRAVESQLAERFSYDRATLVIVAPDPVDAVFETATRALADLPSAPRRARDRTVTLAGGDTPRRIAAKGGHGSLVWPIAADPAAQLWAQAICTTLNQLRRAEHEPVRARLRCTIDDDPRRAVMVLIPSGTDDAVALVRDRLQRVAQDERGGLTRGLEATAAQARHAWRSPLPLARQLARARAPGPAVGGDASQALDELVGLAAIERERSTTRVAHWPELGNAVQVIEPTPASAGVPP